MKTLEEISKIPHSLEAEQAILGGIFVEPDLFEEVLEIVSPEDFYKNMYSVIFRSMLEVYRESNEIDMVLIKNKLLQVHQFTEEQINEELSNILENSFSAVNLKEYARLVKEKAILRRLGEAGRKITEIAYRDDRDAEDILDEAESIVLKVDQQKKGKEIISLREAAKIEFDRLERIEANQGETVGVTTGFSDLDKDTGGWNPSDLVIVAARPAMGKTAFALNLVLNAAKKGNKSILVFSLEMSTQQLYQRFMSIEAGVALSKIRNGHLDSKDWGRLGAATDIIGNYDITIADIPNVNVLEIRALARKIKSRQDLDMIVIDYLQLIRGSSVRSESRQQEISEISRSLKSLARELDIPIIALSQLSRSPESRPDKRPMLSDLRESGAIEQDADVVIFLYRDDYYNQESPDAGITEIIIGKQRNGPTSTVKLRFFHELTKFANFTTRVD